MGISPISRNKLETAVVVLSWFAVNISMGTSTKWIYLHGKVCVEGEGCESFTFPLLVSMVHMIMSSVLCALQQKLKGKGSETAASTPKLTFKEQSRKIGPLALSFSLSIGMGNLALKYIYPSFNQMLGSIAPLVTVALAVLWQGKSYNWYTWFAVAVVSFGIILCSTKEFNFSMLGVFFALGSTTLRALKSIIQGQILDTKMDSLTLLSYMAPWAFGFLGFFSLISEGLAPYLLIARGLGLDLAAPSGTGGGRLCFFLLLSGSMAFVLNLLQFMVTARTNAVTLQVLGNVKNCAGIFFSVAVLGNEVTMEQGLGVAICLWGVWLYNNKGGAAAKPITAKNDNDSADDEKYKKRGTTTSSQRTTS